MVAEVSGVAQMASEMQPAAAMMMPPPAEQLAPETEEQLAPETLPAAAKTPPLPAKTCNL